MASITLTVSETASAFVRLLHRALVVKAQRRE
jgi:hypothetical protein